jgi:hypothetical protein
VRKPRNGHRLFMAAIFIVGLAVSTVVGYFVVKFAIRLWHFLG